VQLSVSGLGVTGRGYTAQKVAPVTFRAEV
jgi:hypothetical protein